MTQHSRPQQQQTSTSDNSSQPFNDVVKSLGEALKGLFSLIPSVVVTVVFIFLICVFLLFRAIDVSYLYSAFVTLLFILLSICLYITEKKSLNAIFSFSLGIFTAFTVPWNGSTFTIFFVSFIVLVIGIFFIASIRMAAKEQERLTTAASSYIHDPETNKKELKEIYETVKKQAGLLSIENKQEAILFFAYQKVAKDKMIMLIEALNFIYTMTKLDVDVLLVLLNNISYLSHTEEEFTLNKETLKLYILKGKSTPKSLINMLNDTLYIAIENDIDFRSFTDTILTYLSRGYTQATIVEQLAKKFEKKAS
ncbi:MAG TPA: hypothetical protein VKY19_14165 [Ktedonosporobacter sp.]|jgi:predicted PurR-regulated permease PerM|nr:hypothetical protein [Ktedonosporobacter sp.]